MDPTSDDDSSSCTDSDSDSDSCDMGPWESLPIDSMVLALNIQRAEGEARHTKYHEKLAKFKERQETLLQRRIARLKLEGINIDAEALKRRSKPRLKKSAWPGEDDDDHRRRSKQKANDNCDEDSDDMYIDSDEGTEDENQEPRDYAEWYAKTYGIESETQRKSAESKTKNKKKKSNNHKSNNKGSEETVKLNAFKAVRNVISATNYMERRVIARQRARETMESIKKSIQLEPDKALNPPEVQIIEPQPEAEPNPRPKPSFKDVKQKLKRANVKVGATSAFNSPRPKNKKPFVPKRL